MSSSVVTVSTKTSLRIILILIFVAPDDIRQSRIGRVVVRRIPTLVIDVPESSRSRPGEPEDVWTTTKERHRWLD